MGAWCSTVDNEVFHVNTRKLVVERQLGEGGFSYVYLVKDKVTGQTFALKKMLCQTDELLATARREAEVLSRFDHPNIMKLIDHAIVPSRTVNGAQEVYMLMPYHQNGTLQDVIEYQIKTKGPNCRTPFTERHILTYFLGICQGIEQFHKLNPPLALRDLKPANVLRDRSGQAVLMDFGSVTEGRIDVKDRKSALALQEHADQMSTPPYRAPELFNIPSQITIDERTDIWSLGCLLYALIYCKGPFDTATSVSLAVLNPVEYPSTNISSDLVDLVKFMLVTDHLARPNIQEVIAKASALHVAQESPRDAATAV